MWWGSGCVGGRTKRCRVFWEAGRDNGEVEVVTDHSGTDGELVCAHPVRVRISSNCRKRIIFAFVLFRCKI